MQRRLEHAITLGTNTRSQRRIGILLQKAIASRNSLRQIPSVLKAKNLRRQSNIKMTKIITTNINRAPNGPLGNDFPVSRQHINNSHNHSHIERQTEPIVPRKNKAPTKEPPTPPNGT